MASNAFSGVGSLFRRWSGSEWDNIAEVNNISGPGMTRETIDVSSLNSTGGYREFITGFRDAGTISMSVNLTRDTLDTFKADFESDTAENYEIVLPDDEVTTLEFEGLVTEMPLTIPPDDKVTIDVTIKITGQVTVASGSGSV